MVKKIRLYKPTILIMEGKPYRLKKNSRRGVSNPCELCDLRQICGAPDDEYVLLRLCRSDNRDDAWYFEEDRTIFNKPLYFYLIPELAIDK